MANAPRKSVRLLYRNLSRRRDELGLTDQEIAEKIGVKYSWWRGLLNGKCYADNNEVERICELLGVPAEQVPHVHRPRTA